MTSLSEIMKQYMVEGGDGPFIEVNDDEYYDTSQAARILKKEPTTLRNSRNSGRLSGVTGPAWVKRGSRAYYLGRTLKAWLGQFCERTSTKEEQPATNSDQEINKILVQKITECSQEELNLLAERLISLLVERISLGSRTVSPAERGSACERC